jgi:hypothetical protein
MHLLTTQSRELGYRAHAQEKQLAEDVRALEAKNIGGCEYRRFAISVNVGF